MPYEPGNIYALLEVCILFMTKTTTTLTKNFTVLLGSQVITWTLTMVLMVFLPRYLGAVNMGKLHFAVSIWSILGIIMAFGMDAFMVKEIARDNTKISTYFGTKAVLSTLFFFVCMATLLLILNTFNYSPITINVIILIGLEFWIWQFVGGNEAVLQGIEQMQHISVGRIVGHSLNVGISVTLLLLGWGIYIVSALRILSALIVFAVQFYTLKRVTPLRPQLDVRLAPSLLSAGRPYFLASISMVTYMHLDVVIMSFLVDEQAIGWYGTADQLFGTLLFIPTAFITAVYPIYSKLSVNELEPLQQMMSKSFDSMLLVSVPIGLGLFLIARPLVLLLYGTEFTNSGPVLAAFGIVLILTYLNMLVGQFLISIDRQTPWAIVMFVATLATIPLDLWLIPWSDGTYGNGALGGAFAFIITEIGMLASGLYLLPSKTLGLSNVWSAIRILTAGLTMLGTAWWFQEQFIGVPIAVGAAVYITLILLFRVIPKEDMESVKESIQSLAGRLVRREATAM